MNIVRVLFSNELKRFRLTIPGYKVIGLFLVFLLLSKLGSKNLRELGHDISSYFGYLKIVVYKDTKTLRR